MQRHGSRRPPDIPNRRYGVPRARSGTCVTDQYSLLHIAARNTLASGFALAILLTARAGIPRPYDEAVCQDLRADAGIVEQRYFPRAACSTRARRPDRTDRLYYAHLPSPNTARCVCKTRRSGTFCGSGTCCPCPRDRERSRRPGAIDCRLEMRRSIYANRVNSARNLALGTVFRTKFLNELAPPVNIEY
jgi:hypothetical protein